jgi:hypothetical protein
VTSYDSRVDELAAELLESDVDAGGLERRREALIHELLDVLAAAYRDDQIERQRSQHPARVAGGHKGRATHLRLVSGG